jgi:hypothetical protein
LRTGVAWGGGGERDTPEWPGELDHRGRDP